MKIKFLFLLTVVSLFFTGCESSRQMSLLPPINAGIQPSKIYLLRPHRFAGDGTAADLYLDGQLISRLASGDYTMFSVAPGSHMIGCKLGWSGFGSQKVDCEAGKEYFFRTIVAVTPLSVTDGQQLKASLNYVPLN